eukprot:351030-Chlamydomonas_euryale.AAC.3
MHAYANVGDSGRALPRTIKGSEALRAQHWCWMPVLTCSADVRLGWQQALPRMQCTARAQGSFCR